MEQQEQSIWSEPIASASEEKRASFIRQTYSHLAIALLSFIVLEYFAYNTDAIRNMMMGLWSSMGGIFIFFIGFVMVSNWAHATALKTRDRNKQYLALGIFVVAEVLFFVPVLGRSAMINQDAITLAGFITLGLFAGLSAVVFVTKKDFSFLRTAITIGSGIVIAMIIAGIFIGGLWTLICGAAVLVVAGTILFQTSQVMRTYDTDQHVAASLGLFSSFVTLFYYVLMLVSGRD